ncbi:MAG: hypothetical protein OXH70_04775 [Acidobacteria bacterium]|nr:hypothetical protein [Acidobacteriota bacterium]
MASLRVEGQLSGPGTLFERGLDPSKRSQLGAHYTDREKVMLIVEPVVVRPLEAEWSEVKEKIALKLEQEKRQKAIPAARRRRREAENLLREFLDRLRTFTVLDPACGSGNFLYLALHALKDLEHRVQLEAEALGSFQRQLSRSRPGQRQGHRDQPVRRRTRPGLDLDRRDPVDAAQRLLRRPRSGPRSSGDHRVP